MKGAYFFWLFQFLTLSLVAQFSDDFSGSTLADHWQGEVEKFKITAGELQLFNEGSSGGTTALYTLAPTSTAAETVWRLSLRNEFAPSGSNFATVYLATDQPPISDADLQGYYLKIGGASGTVDRVELYRQDGSSSTLLLQGEEGAVGNDPVLLGVEVRRTAAGEWSLAADYSGGTDYVAQGTVMDDTYTSALYFGLQCRYTATRDTLFYFDNIFIDPIVVDDTPPVAQSVEAINSNQVLVVANEPLGEEVLLDPANYSVNNGIGNAQTVAFDNGDPTRLLLGFTNSFVNQTTYELQLNNLTDFSGNINPTQVLPFEFFMAEAAAPGDILLTEIFHNPNGSPGLPDFEYVEIYNNSNKVLDLAGYSISNGGAAKTLDAYLFLPGTYVTLCDRDAEPSLSTFGSVATAADFPGLVNGGDDVILFNASGQEILAVTYSNDWFLDPTRSSGGYALELIDLEQSNTCPGNWRGSIAGNGGTPGMVNSVVGLPLETNPPELLFAFAASAAEIVVRFDDPVVDDGNLRSLFSLDQGINILLATLEDDGLAVRLALNDPLVENTIYELSVLAGIADCLGNQTTATQTTPVGLSQLAEPGDLIFTEILADPSPPVGLPEFEYVEILNVSDKLIDLANFGLSTGGSPRAIDPFLLAPGGYVALCDQGAREALVALGPVATVENFPSLNNTSSELILFDRIGVAISSIVYSKDWYDNDLQLDGGYSLELIDPTMRNDCPGNWRGSESDDGGTPGQPNSLLGAPFEAIPPVLLSTFAVSPTEVLVRFNDVVEDVDDLADFFAVSPAIVVGDAFPESEGQFIRLFLSSPLSTNTIYELSVTAGLADCIGNQTQQTQTIKLGLAEDPVPGDVVINEILFNPYTGGVDFLELYNLSDKILNLRGVRLRNDSITSGTISEVVEEDAVIFPQDYIVFTEDPQNILDNYVVPNPGALIENPLPSLGNEEGNISVYNATFDRLDALDYTEDWHSRLLDSRDGVSLERLRFDGPTQSEGNWASAASVVGFATPTGPNSQERETVVAPTEDFFSLPEPTFSPDGDSFQDVLEIQYSTDGAGYVAQLFIFDAQGRPVRQLGRLELLAGQGSFLWDGSTDDGDRARVGIYILVAEVFTPDGNTIQEKHTLVLAAVLD